MKTSRPMKKMDDKWAGPFKVITVYPKACRIMLLEGMKIFPVFHTSLLRLKDPNDTGLPGQTLINNREANNIRGRILERIDGHEEVEKWEFTDILDSHDDLGKGIITYQVKWKHQKPTWQVATDLKGQEEAILKFHERYPEKPGPPSWVKISNKEAITEGFEKTLPLKVGIKGSSLTWNQNSLSLKTPLKSTKRSRHIRLPLRYQD
ncbi:hypothetical protein K3495_g15309 [Podosphaera aphanis]|nr:hypothetical protein K3495_g15309 [Podosphaera aphanis]